MVDSSTTPDRRSLTVDAALLQIFQQQPVSENEPYITSAPPMDPNLCDLDWYLRWLGHQIARLPSSILDILHDAGSIKSSSLSMDSSFLEVFIAVNEHVCQGESRGIDEIIMHLIQKRLFVSDENDTNTFLRQRHLVFAILGWQSMLFLPSLNTCPLNEFAVYQDINQPNSRLVFDTLKMSTDLADREMAVLLKGFGNLLPARSPDLANVASEASKVASAWFPIDPAEVNIHLLSTLLRVRLHWVETLALHLDYDQTTRTLSLFRFPSFCVATLRSKGALYSFASSDRHSPDPRASHDEITDILNETLLSYRLLFGLSKPSRELFRRLFKSIPELYNNGDKLLYALCAEKFFEHPIVPKDCPMYFADRDFPVLGGRIKLLVEELKEVKPKSWRELLRDRRNTTQYWTFWLVTIFGAASIVLSTIQVLLQGLSLR